MVLSHFFSKSSSVNLNICCSIECSVFINERLGNGKQSSFSSSIEKIVHLSIDDMEESVD